MSAIDRVTWDEVWQGLEPGRLGDHEVQFIAKQRFLKNKEAAGREKDLAGIEALRLKGP